MLLTIGFERSKVDPQVYTVLYRFRLFMLAAYVDECILIGKQGPFILSFKTDFSSRFQIENLGPMSWLLGCRIERDRPNRILRVG